MPRILSLSPTVSRTVASPTVAALALLGSTQQTSPPIEIGRTPARDAAGEELERHIYLREEPGMLARALGWVREQFSTFLETVLTAAPGGTWPLLAIPLLVLLVIIVVRWRVGPLARRRARTAEIFTAGLRTAAEHRQAAETAEAEGAADTAVREWFRALVRDLEERTILPARPGRTAGEVAREVAALNAEAGRRVQAAARAFDEVCYGGRVATTQTVATVRVGADAASGVRVLTEAAR